ncbi:MAG: OmpA family protein [Terracidiphilus sp.]|jgi:outer membrane protein OmpA-like peptidoglycan-associated protein
MKLGFLLAIGSVVGLSALAQASAQTTAVLVPAGSETTYRTVFISRTVQAINYGHRDGVTDVNFAGTALLPSADGRAKVRTKRGTMEVEAEFGNLQSPTTFGAEYLTYVLWAISPEGRAANLGEVLVGDNDRSKLKATTEFQAFALVVTAEPYYAVRQPSNVVVMENVVSADTKGTSEAVDAKYELMERGGYIPTGYKFDPVVLSASLPLEFYEARNALRIAQSEGAEAYAGESYRHAVALMDTANGYAANRRGDKKPLIAASRQAVQTAEDAREIAVKKIDEMRLAEERQNSSDALTMSQAQADEATRLKEKAQSDAARSQADAADAQANAANEQANATTAQANAARAQADLAANQTASAAAITAAQADADQSRLIASQAQQGEQQANSDKAAMRARLSEQLNLILETRDSARGLIVSMSDVLFDTGKYSLLPGAREKLAKVAGILISYPGLNIAVGGYTDNVGGDAMNQTLSENRAGSVRDYLVRQGVSGNSVSAQGFGNSVPVASNDNSSGRQQNRRVELVVSGDAIGSPVQATTGSL